MSFHKTPAPSTEHVAEVVERIAVEATRWLIRQGVRDLEAGRHGARGQAVSLARAPIVHGKATSD